MRKIALILVFALLLSFNVVAFSDVSDTDNFKASVEKLASLGILNGYEDGSFRPYDTVTRAQFAKLVTIIIGEKDNAVLNSTAIAFSDVSYNFWASGYIGLVSEKGLISGYGDGTFLPDKSLSHAEAITIIVRMLGYTAADIGYHWPDSYIEKARALGIITDLSFDPYAPISRGEVAVLLDRALYKDTKSGAKLIKSMNITEYEDCVIIATQKNDPSLSYDVVSTSAGAFKRGALNEDNLVGSKVDLFVDKDGKIFYISQKNQSKKVAVIEQLVDNEVTVNADGRTEKIKLQDTMVIYYKGLKTNVAQTKTSLIEGNELHLYGENGNIDYAFLYEYEMKGPYTVTENIGELTSHFGIVDTSSLKVIKDGYSSSLNKIVKFDVAYYTERTNTLYIYDDKVTGTYDEAYPMKSSVTSISLSGKTYTLEGSLAMSKLNESANSFKIGDKVTLLLSKDGKVADAVNLDGTSISSFGVIISTFKAVSSDIETKGKTDYYTTIMKADGVQESIKSDKDYELYKGQFVSISYNGGIASFTASGNSPISGNIDRASMTIGGHKLAQNYSIIELVKYPANKTPVVQKIVLSDINVNMLTSSDVIHAQIANEFGDILVLYVNNLTNSNYEYGLLTKNNVNHGKASVSGSYTVLINGAEKNYNVSNAAYSVVAQVPVGIDADDSSLNHMYQLTTASSGSGVESITTDRVKQDGIVYKMDENVQIYKDNGNYTYNQLSMAQLLEYKSRMIYLYSDRAISNGGIVRVIVVK